MAFNSWGIKVYLFVLSIVIATIFLLILSFVTYRVTVSAILNRTENLDESNLKQVNNKIVLSIGEIERLTSNFSKNEPLIGKMQQLSPPPDSMVDKLRISGEIVQLLNEMKVGYEDIDRIEVFTRDGTQWIDKMNAYPDQPRILQPAMLETIQKMPRNVAVFAPGTSNIVGERLKGFAFGSVLYDDNRGAGILQVVMKPQWMDQVFEGNNVIIASKENDKVLWSTSGGEPGDYAVIIKAVDREQGTFIDKIHGAEYRFFYMKSAYNDWLTITYKSLKEIYSPVKKIRMYVLLTASISCLVSFVCAVFVSGIIARPIVSLQDSVRAYSAQERFQEFKIPVRSMGMKKMVMMYFVSITVIPMLICIVTFHFSFSAVIEQKVKESVLLAFRQTVSNIDSFISINEKISTNIMVNPSVQRFLAARLEPGDGSRDGYIEEIGKSIDENLSLADNIFESALYDSDQQLVFSTSYFNNKETIREKAANYVGKPYWISNELDKYNRNVLRLIRKIRGIRNDSHFLQTIGYLQTTYYESNIETLYREVNLDNNNLFIMDETGMIVSHKSKTLVGTHSGLFDEYSLPSPGTIDIVSSRNNDNLVILAAGSNIPWVLAGEFDKRVFKEDSLHVLTVNLYILAALVMFVILFSHFAAKGMTSSIEKLKRKLGLFADGYLQVDFGDKTKLSEMQELGHAFNSMALRIRELIETVYRSTVKEKELEHEKKEAELIALQAQINPHFLYNTMESIKWMIKSGRKEQAVEMITALGSLFQIGIRRANRLITIREELDYARAYIEIQKVRLGDRVNFFWSVDQALYPFLAPRLILQPVIENAIMHGVRHKNDRGNISIYCYGEGGSVVFQIIDDGIGMDLSKPNQGSAGIGISNVRKRIHLYFGEEYGVFIESSPRMGTSVKITIPRMKEENGTDS